MNVKNRLSEILLLTAFASKSFDYYISNLKFTSKMGKYRSFVKRPVGNRDCNYDDRYLDRIASNEALPMLGFIYGDTLSKDPIEKIG